MLRLPPRGEVGMFPVLFSHLATCLPNPSCSKVKRKDRTGADSHVEISTVSITSRHSWQLLAPSVTVMPAPTTSSTHFHCTENYAVARKSSGRGWSDCTAESILHRG